MSDRTRWVQARWRAAQARVWEHELSMFGPLPERTRSRAESRDRTLWEVEAYSHIVTEARRARRHAAVQARRNGATFEQLGRALGVSRQAAQKLIQRHTPTAGGFMTDHKAG